MNLGKLDMWADRRVARLDGSRGAEDPQYSTYKASNSINDISDARILSKKHG